MTTRQNADDIVVSTRIRLARNFRDFPFSSKLSDEQAQKIITLVYDALKTSPALEKDLTLCEMSDLSDLQKQSLVERHLISPEFARKTSPHALILSKDEHISIMVNEEDHLRLQIIRPGLCPEECLKEAVLIDKLLDETVAIAFSNELGYLTHCPTNLGTGLRASVMMHLPMLTRMGEIRQMMSEASKLGLTVRGLYGEGSDVRGELYQISNQLTLGFTEEEIIDRLRRVTENIMTRERSLREHFLEKSRNIFEDKVWRACGLLQNARMMSSAEAESLLSDLRLGLSCGVVHGVDFDTLNHLMYHIEPATLSLKDNALLSGNERDQKRAEYLRGLLQGKITA